MSRQPFAHALSCALLALAAGAALASPCQAPADFVRAGAAGQARQPLLRPFVVQGLAVTALHQRAGQSWLELAVDSEATARRTLGTHDGEVQATDGAVLLSCRSGAAAAAPPRTATPALW